MASRPRSTTSRGHIELMTSEREHEPQKSPLLQLANELMRIIIDHTFHDDLVHLAMTCRTIHDLAVTALQEHRVLLQEMTILNKKEKSKGLDRILRMLIEKPQRALYIRELEVGLLNNSWQSYHQSIDKVDTQWIVQDIKHGSLRKFVDDLLTEETGYQDCDLSSILRCIENGDEEPIVSLILALAPNIVRMNVQLRHTHAGLMNVILRTARISTTPQNCFTNLKSATIKGGLVNIDDAYLIVRACAQIPSLETLTAVRCSTYGGVSRFPGTFTSNVKHLTLEQCALSDREIVSIVQGMRYLKNFTYIHDDFAESHDPRPRFSHIADALLISTEGYLETLQMTGLDEWLQWEKIYIGNLRSFKALRELIVDLGLLFKNHTGLRNYIDLNAVLPVSIRSVRIDCEYHPEIIDDYLDLFMSKPLETSMSLERLELWGLRQSDIENLIDAGYDTQLAASGTKLAFAQVLTESGYRSIQDIWPDVGDKWS